MIEFTPFRAAHLQFLKPQEAQRRDFEAITASGRADMLEGPLALTAWHNSRCVAVAGCIAVWPHRAMGWALLSCDVGPAMLAVTRKVRRVFTASPYKRIEITVDASFEDGHRFARLLGAVRETPEPMNFYGAHGGDEVMYAMLKGV